jgi:hypothetical protein
MVRSSRLDILATVAAMVSVSACTLDHRGLQLKVSYDGGDDSFTSGAQEDGGPRIINVSDSGSVDYGSYLDSGHHDSGPADEGPCVHTDLNGKLDCSDTLTVNSDFNRDWAGWRATGNAAVRWVKLDVQGSGMSGSIAVKAIEQGDFDGNSEAAASQCIAAVPGSTYAYEVWTFIAHGQPYGQSQLEVWFHDQPQCAALVSDNGAYALNSLDVTDHWNLLRGSLHIPQTVHSMSLRLVSRKPYRNDPMEVLFDAVRVTKTMDAPE